MSSTDTTDTDFDVQLAGKADIVNAVIHRLLDEQKDIHADLDKAIRYTLEAPGKRIRAALVLFCCELLAGQANQNAEIAAAAVEMVHTYSLVHDDLPAMDNDDFRRGLPTCHKAFDQATAILAGDALLTMAFEILATRIDKPAVATRLIRRLAVDAGPAGMIAGQIADLKAENTKGSEELLRYIHTNKTAKMFRCSAAMGAICADADKAQVECLSEYGLKIGLGFQIADDILDVSASTKQLGKTAGKDAAAAKCTYPAIVGIDESKRLAKELAEQAVKTLDPFGPKAINLRSLALALLERTR